MDAIEGDETEKGGSLGRTSRFSALDNAIMLALFAALTNVLTRRKITLHLIDRCDCDEEIIDRTSTPHDELGRR